MEHDAVNQQIARILQSLSFSAKGQLRKLLEVLYKNIDTQSSLNPELIIKELWPTEIRTKRSADVATEMNRLRHALEDYYNGEGKGDTVIIYLPNRTANSAAGAKEKRWIAAHPRNGEEPAAGLAAENGAQTGEAQTRAGLKLIGALAVVGILSVAAYLTRRALAIPDQPRRGRLDGSTLIVMDAQGKELWRKVFEEGFGPESYYGNETRIWFADLEAKGHTSVLFSYLPAPSAQPHSTTLICYSDRGREKWRWTPGRELPEVSPGATYRTFSVGVLNATEKRAIRLVAISNHDPWYGGPSQVAVIDADGKALSEYWHSGGLRDMAVADLDGDGKQEILLAGIARGYDAQATLIVLDADGVAGASKEVQPEFQIHGWGAAKERLRLLFPRSDLNQKSFQFSFPVEPRVQDGILKLDVQQCAAGFFPSEKCSLRYEFDRNLHLIAMHPENDEFRLMHDQFYKSGKDAHTISAEEQADLLKVRCLVGCQADFVPVAQTYNPAATFEEGWTTQRNPNGVWSYGYSSGFTKPITLYDKAARNGINGPNAQFWLSSSVDTGTSPSAEFNHGPADNDGNIDFRENEFVLVSGIGGQYSDLVFTAPADGMYSIAGNFRGAQYGIGTVAGVVVKGELVVKASLTSVGQVALFRLAPSLQAGNAVVFSVGPGGGTQNTGLSVTITKPCAAIDRPALTPAWGIECSGRHR